MRVDGHGRFVDPFGIDFRGHEARSIAECARVELRGLIAARLIEEQRVGDRVYYTLNVSPEQDQDKESDTQPLLADGGAVGA
jgi:hypothetical protein